MNKRGQFYIVSAIIIVIIVSSLLSVATYSFFRPGSKTLKDIGSDLREETPRIIDFGIYNNQSLYSLMYNFTVNDFALYFLQKTDYSNATFIFGNKTDLYQISYVKGTSGTITLGNSEINVITSKGKKEMIKVNPGQNTVSVKILEQTFEFNLKDNEMFYFVITKENEGEVFIEKNG